MITFRTAPAALAATLLAAIAMPAAVSAHERTGSWQIGDAEFHIYNADLDMHSRAGRAAMLARVERAAETLCAPLTVDRAACVADTVTQTTRASGGALLQLALNERRDRAYAAR